jgi:aryl-alcohol dehydrogenase-like predicted oxidoreductase
MNNYGYSINSGKLGLGCVTFGREIDRDTSFMLMDHAYSRGITSFDTAAVYGDGSSERIIGRWLAERALSENSIGIATKILPPYDPLHIRISVEQCLRRLGTETIDILYLHRWDEKVRNHQTWSELADLVSEGKIKELGASNFNTLQLANAVNLLKEIGDISLSYIQNNHNLAVSDISDEMKKICKENEIRIITYSPLGAGFLTGKHLYGVQKDSRFEVIPAHQDIYFNEHSQKRLERLLGIAERTGYSPAYLALAWAAHQPDVYSVLVGGRSVAHLDLAFEAGKFYSPEIFAELENV